MTTGLREKNCAGLQLQAAQYTKQIIDSLFAQLHRRLRSTCSYVWAGLLGMVTFATRLRVQYCRRFSGNDPVAPAALNQQW